MKAVTRRMNKTLPRMRMRLMLAVEWMGWSMSSMLTFPEYPIGEKEELLPDWFGWKLREKRGLVFCG